MHLRFQNRKFTPAFAVRPSFRATGLRLKLYNHAFTPVFDAQPSCRAKRRCLATEKSCFTTRLCVRHTISTEVCPGQTNVAFHHASNTRRRPRQIRISPHVWASDTRDLPRGCRSFVGVRIHVHHLQLNSRDTCVTTPVQQLQCEQLLSKNSCVTTSV